MLGVEYVRHSELLLSVSCPSTHPRSVFCLSACYVTYVAIVIQTVPRSDVLPRMVASFLDYHSALWRALVDNLCHAGIAAASWMVVASLRYDGGIVLVGTRVNFAACRFD